MKPNRHSAQFEWALAKGAQANRARADHHCFICKHQLLLIAVHAGVLALGLLMAMSPLVAPLAAWRANALHGGVSSTSPGWQVELGVPTWAWPLEGPALPVGESLSVERGAANNAALQPVPTAAALEDRWVL